VAALFPVQGRAQEVEAGWEGGAVSGYAFARPAVRIGPDGRHALILFATGSYLYYHFPGRGGSTRVTSPGIGGALGYRLSTETVTATLGVGYEVRRTLQRSDNQALAQRFASRFRERGVTLEGDASIEPSPGTELTALVSWTGSDRYRWARAGFSRRLSGSHRDAALALRLGLDGTAQGNADVRELQAGAVFVLELLHTDASLELRSGLSRVRYTGAPAESRPYAGVTVYRAF
jgi:hypothetical protein